MRVFILEDNAGRCAEMKIMLAECNAQLAGEICASASHAIEYLKDHILDVDVICLDHDLVSTPEISRPGDGRDVVSWLVNQPIKKPVLIHTNNGPFGREMERELKAHNWHCESLAPYCGNDWIRLSWIDWLQKITSNPAAA